MLSLLLLQFDVHYLTWAEAEPLMNHFERTVRSEANKHPMLICVSLLMLKQKHILFAGHAYKLPLREHGTASA